MRKHPLKAAESCRRGGEFGAPYGAFLIPLGRAQLRVIACDGSENGWDHVSVSLASRCPTWEEMTFVRGLFFTDDEWPIQYGPPMGQNININEFCLHWWLPVGVEIPRPPEILV